MIPGTNKSDLNSTNSIKVHQIPRRRPKDRQLNTELRELRRGFSMARSAHDAAAEAKVTQSSSPRLLEWPRSQMSRIENGKANPTSGPAVDARRAVRRRGRFHRLPDAA